MTRETGNDMHFARGGLLAEAMVPNPTIYSLRTAVLRAQKAGVDVAELWPRMAQFRRDNQYQGELPPLEEVLKPL